ncbi:MAG: hypothetical protein ACJ72G_12205 [Friedmanniella sp.]
MQHASNGTASASSHAPAGTAASAVAVRSGGIDALRVLAILAVVLGHVWLSDFVYKLVCPWHVAIFFFLTG